MFEALLIVVIVLVIAALILQLRMRAIANSPLEVSSQLELEKRLERVDRSLRDEVGKNRQEASEDARSPRDKVSLSLRDFNESVFEVGSETSASQKSDLTAFGDSLQTQARRSKELSQDILSERVIEDLIEAFSEELLGEPLVLIGRQMTLGKKRTDLLFRDAHGRELIVEIKRGEITRKALGQVGEYLGMLKNERKNQDFRFMLVGTFIPPERKTYFELIGCEVIELDAKSLADFAQQKGIDLAVGIPKERSTPLQPVDPAIRHSLPILGITGEESFLDQLHSQPNSEASERVIAVYALLKSFPSCDFRFKEQGRAIFSVIVGAEKIDIAYVGLNRKYGTGDVGKYGHEVVVLWRNIANKWPEQTTMPFRDVLVRIAPKKKQAISSTSQKEGVYVGINIAKDFPEENFQILLSGMRGFMHHATR